MSIFARNVLDPALLRSCSFPSRMRHFSNPKDNTMNLSNALVAAATTGILGALTGCGNSEPAKDPSTEQSAATPEMSATPAPAASGTEQAEGEKHACKGQNSCKGQGGCKTDKNACKGQNSCKGQGGCKTA